MDESRKNAGNSIAVNRLEDVLQKEFLEQERRWDEQDLRRYDLRTKHKEHALKRLELQRRAGQAYTLSQVELATAPATSQHLLPMIVRRSLRNGEYAYHGKNCSVQEMRHCSCKFGSRMIEEARECTHTPVQSRKIGNGGTVANAMHEPQSPPSTGKKSAPCADRSPATDNTEWSSSGTTPKSQSKQPFTTLISVKDRPLEAKPDYSLTSIIQPSNSKVELLTGLSMQLFDPCEIKSLVEDEKNHGNGRKLEESMLYKSTLEAESLNWSGLLNTASRGIEEALHGRHTKDASEAERAIKTMPISFFDNSKHGSLLSLSAIAGSHNTIPISLESIPSSAQAENNSNLDPATSGQSISEQAPTISAFTFHENYESYKSPYLVMYTPKSRLDMSRTSLKVNAGPLRSKKTSPEQPVSPGIKTENTISLPQVLRCNRLAQKLEPLELAKVEPVAFVSDATKILTEEFQQPFKHTKKEKLKGARVQFANQALFKIGLNDNRIAELCDSDSDDYVMHTKHGSTLQHKQVNCSDDYPDSFDGELNSFSRGYSGGTNDSQRGLLDGASLNISVIHKEQGPNAKGSSFTDNPSALIKEFENMHFARINSRTGADTA